MKDLSIFGNAYDMFHPVQRLMFIYKHALDLYGVRLEEKLLK